MLEARVPDVFSVTGKSVAGLVLHVPTVGVGHGVDELLSSRSICEIIVSELITVPASIGTLLLEGDVSGSVIVRLPVVLVFWGSSPLGTS